MQWERCKYQDLVAQCKNVPACHWLWYVFSLVFFRKKNDIFNNIFFFNLFFFSSFLIVFDCLGQGDPRSLNELHYSATWMVWHTGLGHLPLLTCALVVRGGGMLLDHGNIPMSICLSVCWRSPGVGLGGGGCSHSPRGPAHYLCLGLG